MKLKIKQKKQGLFFHKACVTGKHKSVGCGGGRSVYKTAQMWVNN